jgi:transcriptional regulator with XRE-family HTH domain
MTRPHQHTQRDELLVAFGERVRLLRLAKHLSQERLAQLAGLHRTHVGQIERGEQAANLVNIGRLSRALGVELAELFTGVALPRQLPPPRRRPDARHT